MRLKNRGVITSLLPLLATTFVALNSHAATLTSIYDFAATPSSGGSPNHVKTVYDAPLIVGTGSNTTFYFVSQRGGMLGEGMLLSYHLSSGTMTSLISDLGGSSSEGIQNPARPEATPTLVSHDGKDYLYFTTTNGGIAGKGTLNRYDIATGSYETVWHSDLTLSPTLDHELDDGRTPRGEVYAVDRGADGIDIYFSTSGGGAEPSTSSGAIYKFNTKDYTPPNLETEVQGGTSLIHDFDGVNADPALTDGGAPYDGFVKVGNDLYLTTAFGGQGPATGGGTIGVVRNVNSSTPTYETVALLSSTAATTASNDRLAFSTPVYDSSTNSLYYVTNGSNASPGTIQRYSIDTNTVDIIYELASGNTSGANSEGRLIGYTSPFLFGDYLYYLARTGGENNVGVISRYDLVNNSNEVLYHLDNATYGGTPWGDFGFSDYDFDNDGTPNPSLYFFTSSGGANGNGGILRLGDIEAHAVPEPTRFILALTAIAWLSLRRKRNHQ